MPTAAVMNADEPRCTENMGRLLPLCEWAYHCPTCEHLLMFCTCAAFPPVFPDASLPLTVSAEGIVAYAMHKVCTEPDAAPLPKPLPKNGPASCVVCKLATFHGPRACHGADCPNRIPYSDERPAS